MRWHRRGPADARGAHLHAVGPRTPSPWDRASDELLARSLTSEVITRLAEHDRLRVTGRVSSFAFAGFGLPMAEIARPLRVEYLLTGIFCREGTVPTLEVELSDADGYIVWRDRFEQEVNEFDHKGENTLIYDDIQAL